MATEEYSFPVPRMEEIEETEGWARPKRMTGLLRESSETESPEKEPADLKVYDKFLFEFGMQLAEERKAIVEDTSLKPRAKLKLLDSNRKAFISLRGGKVRETENVVYSILIFGATVLIILALLTTFAGLPSEIALSFVGTVLGGTIATISQKLGQV